MIPELRQRFNSAFTAEKYQGFLTRLNQRCGCEIQFRIAETPCFFPLSVLDQMAQYGEELVSQLLNSMEYRRASDASVPAEFNVPNEDAHPLFVSVDFGLVRGSNGKLEPKLVELQAFPTLYAYQAELSRQYTESFALPQDLGLTLGNLPLESYYALLRRVIVGDHDPKNVVLLEIDPQEQKTLPDFLLTEKICSIKSINIRDVVKNANKLYYRDQGLLVPVTRIYNRVIVDELVRKNIKLPFDYRDDLDLEWAGHPNWYFRISKFSIPHLRHKCVPKTWFLSDLESIPDDRENYLLKPLYSFAGKGIVFAPSDEYISSIPSRERHNYILQEKMQFAPVIKTPRGDTQAEVRIMYIWPEGDRMYPVLPLVRMGRGKMMGVDHNRNLEWVGGSAALYQRD
jgi:hypothetical protein